MAGKPNGLQIEAAAPDPEPEAPVAETNPGDVPVDAAPDPSPTERIAPAEEEGITPPTDRASIMKAISDRRREEGAHDLIGMTDPAVYYGDAARPPAGEATDAQGNEAATGVLPAHGTSEAQPPSSNLDDLLDLKVNGVVEKRPLKDVIALAQKNLAADAALANAKAMERQYAALLAQAQGTPSKAIPPATAQPAAPEAPPPEKDADELKRALREIQYGDTDDAAPLLERYIESRIGEKLRAPQSDPAADVRLAVDQMELQKGWQSFTEKNPEYLSDPDRATLFVSKVQREMAADLRALLDDEAYAKVNTGNLGTIHTRMRLNNLGVRHPTQISEKVDQEIKGLFQPAADPSRRPAPTVPTSVPRDARKATYAQPQPTPRANPTPAPSQNAARRDPSAVIAAMRQARQQVV